MHTKKTTLKLNMHYWYFWCVSVDIALSSKPKRLLINNLSSFTITEWLHFLILEWFVAIRTKSLCLIDIITKSVCLIDIIIKSLYLIDITLVDITTKSVCMCANLPV